MARPGREDTGDNEKIIPQKQESTFVDPSTGNFVVPDFKSYNDYSDVGKSTEPVMCKGGRCNHKLPAIVSVKFHAENNPKNLCQLHWDKEKKNIDAYDHHSITWIKKGDEAIRGQIRARDARNIQIGKARDAAVVFGVTGVEPETPIRGRGRPPKPQSSLTDKELLQSPTRDASLDAAANAILSNSSLSKTLDTVATAGGRTPSDDHEDKLARAHQALLHSMEIGEGSIDKNAYHYKAGKLGLDENDRNKYLPLAINHHKTLTKKSIGLPDPTREAALDVLRNPTSGYPVDNYTDIQENYMQSDIPSGWDVGLSQGSGSSID
jgi:hypothetical protein